MQQRPGDGNLTRFRPRRATAGRRGFTLLEVLLVLAVFVAITALAVPAVTGVFSGQQLRSAADIVRARFADARVRSIRTGDVYGFFYQPGTGEYWVAPMVNGFRSLAEGTTPPSHQHSLENGIIFLTGEQSADSRSAAAAGNMTDGARQLSEFRPILFYPDGTSQNATVLLQTRNGLQIQVNLRGLTGVATRSRLASGLEEGVE